MFLQNSLAARVRMLSTGRGRKTDNADALSVGIAARSARTLTSVTVEGAVTALRAIVEHRDNLVKTPTQTINRLQVVLTHLIPAVHSVTWQPARPLSSSAGSDPAIPPASSCAASPWTWSPRYATWTGRIAKATADIDAAVTASGTTLTELCGIGALTAGTAGSSAGRGRGRSTDSAPRLRSPPTPEPPDRRIVR
jgi:transposase